jgi:predicted nucleotidyltransferase
MNDATRWRLALAHRIAAPYARSPNARVVMVAGSVARGVADSYSDIEIDVYYGRPPTEAERVAAAEASGGVLVGLGDDEDEWEERLSFGGFHAHTSTFLVSTMERYLREVVDEHATSPVAQSRLFSLLNAVPVKGEAQVDLWSASAASYPEGLRQAMLAENLGFARFRYMARMLAARDDVLLLNDIFVEVGGRVIGALLGLNGIYLPAPTHPKGMDETIGLMAIKPAELSARLKRVFRVEPAAGVAMLEELVDETLALVEAHVPAFDTTPFRAAPADARTAWDRPPPAVA